MRHGARFTLIRANERNNRVSVSLTLNRNWCRTYPLFYAAEIDRFYRTVDEMGGCISDVVVLNGFWYYRYSFLSQK
jgi:hypothetical protein